MRLLDRYLLRELGMPLVYCLSGFLIFWISSDLLGELDMFQQEKLTVGDLGEYYLARLPEFLVLLLPIVLLLSLLYALSNHARHQEITAMRAAGLGLWRISLPYFLVALMFSLAVYVLQEELAPAGAERAQRVRRRHVDTGPTREDFRWKLDLKFYNDREQRFWRIRAYNVETGEMRDPYVEWRQADGTRRQLLAEEARYANGSWVFLRGQLLDPDPESKTPAVAFAELRPSGFSETPATIRSEYKVTQLDSIKAARKAQLSVAEILEYRWLHPGLSPRVERLLDTQLHRRLAAPWTCLVVVLIAIPFGAASGRRNVFVGVASSIFICFAYYVLQESGAPLGAKGFVPPAVAAWLPNALFGVLGTVLTLRVR